jgi:6-phosphogluconolactonase (cycloisomerase 2 family)
MNPGSGPRHGVFWTPRGSNSKSSDVYFYLVQELSNELSGFRVKYSGNGISFRKIYEGSTYGKESSPAGTKAAEIAISVSLGCCTEILSKVILRLTWSCPKA